MTRQKKPVNNSGIPQHAIEAIARCILPDKNLRNENADTCQAIAFLCLHIFILLCAYIIPKATNTVKGITS